MGQKVLALLIGSLPRVLKIPDFGVEALNRGLPWEYEFQKK